MKDKHAQSVLNNSGFASFVEIIVTTIIFLIAALGIYTTIAILRPQGMKSAKRLEAAYVGKGVMEWLRGQSDARTWEGPSDWLEPGASYSQIFGDYTVSWDVFDEDVVPGQRLLRRVEMTVSWDWGN